MSEAVVTYASIALGLLGYWAIFVVLLHRHLVATRRQRLALSMQQFAAAMAVGMNDAARAYVAAGIAMREAAEALRQFEQAWRRAGQAWRS